jgi:vacuolar-type H+-ATPase subunit C/Vma6
LRYLIDMRNCLMLSKLWRWQVSQPPPLTVGGDIDPTRLQRIWASQDNDRLVRLTERLAGGPIKSGEMTGGGTIGMEQSLLHGLTRLLRRAGRDPLGLAVIIEYLWRAEIAVHNKLLRNALSTDREDLLEEVMLL